MKLTLEQIDLLKDKKIITQVIPSQNIVSKYDTIDALKLAELITLSDPSSAIEDSLNPSGDDYSNQYFTTELLEECMVGYVFPNIGTDLLKSISCSIDGGKTWKTVENPGEEGETPVIIMPSETFPPTESLPAGTKILWKGDATALNDDEGGHNGQFFASGISGMNDIPVKIYGNIMSLLFGDNFKDKTTMTPGCFNRLFHKFPVTDASNLVLPATTLALGCYSGMFNECTSLTSAPSLPATTLAEDCYSGMFSRCSSLTSAPSLPATTLAAECYNAMFSGCTSLTSAPSLPATTLAEGCYSGMFFRCSSLTSAPSLPATTLAAECYNAMFTECSSLTSAPSLPATTLAENCYYGMFSGCTSLTSAPSLPATTLAVGCYSSMFNECTSLTSAPSLPATTLADFCYSGMFSGCEKLNHIECLATDISANNCTFNWVDSVAEEGTFVGVENNPAHWKYGSIGVPLNWTCNFVPEEEPMM